jgi:hypothetical protein
MTTEMIKYIVFSCLLLSLNCLTASADTYSPYPDHRTVDANGRYYAVVKRKGGPKFKNVIAGPCSLTIAERRPCSPLVLRASAYPRFVEGYYVIDKNANVAVRDGDLVLGRCELDAPPLELLISSSGLGIAAVDVWPYNVSDFDGSTKNALVLISLKCEIRYRKDMFDMFGAEKDLFITTGGRVNWSSFAWIDEIRREAIIVTANTTVDGVRHHGLLRAVSFDTGNVRVGHPDDIVRAVPDALATHDYYKLDSALDLASSMRLKDTKPYLFAILVNEKLPFSSRLRAGLVLNDFGDRRGVNLFINTALARDNVWNIYAIEHLHGLLGDDALAVLLRIVQQEGNRINSTVGGALSRLGARAVPALVRMLDDENNPAGQFDAVHVLGMIGPDSRSAVPSLLKALGRKTQQKNGVLTSRIDKSAAWALGQIGPEARDAVPFLNQLRIDDDEDVRIVADEALKLIKNH